MEEIVIENQVWHDDGFGWQGPYRSDSLFARSSTHRNKVPEVLVPAQFLAVKCLGRDTVEGRDLNKYEFTTQTYPPSRTNLETLFTDPQNGRPIRFEYRGEKQEDATVATTYEHDGSIRIELPRVDPQERWKATLEGFLQEVGRADPVCRSEFLAAVRRGSTVPFRYVSRRNAYWGVWGTVGAFVPPASIRHRIEGGAFHGGGTEILAVGDKSWRRDADEWTELPPASDQASRLSVTLIPDIEHVGHVACAGTVRQQGRDYAAYDFDFYLDRSAGRLKEGTARMLLDVDSQRPAGLVARFPNGVWGWVEKRSYDPTLTIAALGRAAAEPLGRLSYEELHRLLNDP